VVEWPVLSARFLSLALALLSAGAAGCTPAPRFAGVSGRAGPCAVALSRSRAPAPGVHVDVTCVYYDVEGDTAEALAASMDSRGPRDEGGTYHAYTLFDLSYGYNERVREGSCHPESIVVLLRLVHVLPERRKRGSLHPDVAAQWDKFTSLLAVHEAGHGKLDVEAALRLSGALGGLSSEASCEALREQAHSAFEVAVAELRRDHRLYDMRTGHGKAQGARFP
jgi:predicted secreted Zn-dependent protease